MKMKFGMILIFLLFISMGKTQGNITPDIITSPDLTITSISIDKTNIIYADTPWTWITYTVKNIGTVDTVGVNAQLTNIFRDGSAVSPTGFMTVGNVVAGGAVNKSFAVGHDSGWPIGSYSLQVFVDYDSQVFENDESNNLSPVISFNVIGNGPNLIISNISIDKTTIVQGDIPWTWVTFTVQNTGIVDALSVNAQLTNIYRDGSAVTPSGFMTLGNVIAGGAVNKSFAVGQDNTWPIGSYSLQVNVDYTNAIVETDETDNLSPVITFDVIGSGPNLIISSISIDKTIIVYEESPWTWITYTVENVGNALATNVNTALANVTRDGISVASTGYMFVGDLATGASVNMTFAVGHDTVWPIGSYSLRVEVDYTNAITEIDESDNFSPSISFDVIASETSSTIDLVISEIVIDNPVIIYGGTLSLITITVNNYGTIDLAVGVNANFTNVIKDGNPFNDLVLGTSMNILGPIPAGGNITYQFNIGVPDIWNIGSYEIQIMIDYDGLVVESIEQNNLSPVLRFEVVPQSGPDLSFNSFHLYLKVMENSSLTMGTLDINVKNTGNEIILKGFSLDIIDVYKDGKLFSSKFMTISYGSQVKAGEVIKIIYEFKNFDFPVGKYTLKFMLDSENKIKELDETNNLSNEIKFEIVSNSLNTTTDTTSDETFTSNSTTSIDAGNNTDSSNTPSASPTLDLPGFEFIYTLSLFIVIPILRKFKK